MKIGYPVSAETSIGSVYKGYFEEVINPEGFPPSAKTYIHFPQRGSLVPVKMVWYDGGILPERPAELLPDEPMSGIDGGMIFEGTKGKLLAGKFGANATLLPTSLMKDRVLPKSKIPLVEGGTEGHQQQWVKACKTGYGSYTSSDFALAGPLTETVLMGNLAVRSYQ
ncbi:MAG: gfo/Idh/MocA family oxidoreductase, partial [Bacteroidota bacterium]|nr:gfo/Idh/MocA family oxidoreductase [Bacteroidota bacterium]